MNDIHGFPNTATPSTPVDDASNMMAFCTTATGYPLWTTTPSITMNTTMTTPKAPALDAYYAPPLPLSQPQPQQQLQQQQWQALSSSSSPSSYSIHRSTIYDTGYPLNSTAAAVAAAVAQQAPATHYTSFTDPIAQSSHVSPVATPKSVTQDILQHDQQQQQQQHQQHIPANLDHAIPPSSSDPSSSSTAWLSFPPQYVNSVSQTYIPADPFSQFVKTSSGFSPTIVSASTVLNTEFASAQDRFLMASSSDQYTENPGFASTADNSVVSDEDQYSSRDDNINKALVAAESRDAAIHASSDDGDEGEILHCRWAECTMQTRSLQRLIAHVSDIHVGRGKQAYYCEWINCPRKNMPFSKRHKMHNHMRTHTGERPFACNEDGCDKRFSRLDSLNTHIKTHSSVKPYACSVPGCTKAYFHSRSLRKHAKVHQIQRDPHGKRKRAGRKKKTSIIAILRKTT